MASESNSLVVELPPHIAGRDSDLHVVAAEILHATNARSVTVDQGRSAAVVRLRAGSSADVAVADGTWPADESVVAACVAEGKSTAELLSWIDPRDQSISFVRIPERVRGWRKAFYLGLAGAALSVGLLGIALPGLPTTPFVLLGSYFLVRSSRTLHERLMQSRIFGGVLRDWYVHRGLRPHVRARAVAVVGMVVAVSLVVARPPWPAVLGIGALAACGLFVIWRLPSVRE